MAEGVVVDRSFKPAVLRIVDPRQFSKIFPNSLTTQVRINEFYQLTSSIEGNGSLVRVALFDFRKAIDLNDHHLLVCKT